jgi:NAD(P)-dependent dehydrogenase (short-subunit alcohol dehydrogenase family)
MSNLSGQVVLITGGGSGLGRGLVKAFLEAGARVGALDNSAQKIADLESENRSGPLVAIQGDVRSVKDNDRAVGALVERFGRLDVFVQCAAIADFTPGLTLLPQESIARAFTEIMEINVLGPILGGLSAAPELRRTKGSIIFTLSTSGFFVGPHSLYNISKNAATGIVRQLAFELAPDVRVNAVVPGAIQGSRLSGPDALGQRDTYPEKAFGADMEKMIRNATPLHLYPSPDDYAPIYLLLADRKAARAATGSMVFWDGGISLVGPGMETMAAFRSERPR